MQQALWIEPLSGNNLKSKIENLKWLGLSVIALVLVVTGVPRWSVTLTSTWTSERIYFVVRHRANEKLLKGLMSIESRRALQAGQDQKRSWNRQGQK
jgi:hypothetical protein